jgi:hypothetical protein
MIVLAGVEGSLRNVVGDKILKLLNPIIILTSW